MTLLVVWNCSKIRRENFQFSDRMFERKSIVFQN